LKRRARVPAAGHRKRQPLSLLHPERHQDQGDQQKEDDEGWDMISSKKSPRILINLQYWNVTVWSSSSLSRTSPHQARSLKEIIHNGNREIGHLPEKDIQVLQEGPPPTRTIPLSTISAANSGGVPSRVIRTVSMIVLIDSARASRTSSLFTSSVFGMR